MQKIQNGDLRDLKGLHSLELKNQRPASSVFNFASKCKGVPISLSERIHQFPYINTQPKTIYLSTRLWGINPTNSVVIPQSLVLRSFVLS